LSAAAPNLKFPGEKRQPLGLFLHRLNANSRRPHLNHESENATRTGRGSES
jgi:hypothetical protein